MPPASSAPAYPAGVPDANPHAPMTHRSRQFGHHIAESVAELGLAALPIHLWLGPQIVTELLSPYVRDLRPTLIAWGRESGELLEGNVTDDSIYDLAQTFRQSDSALVKEHREADRSVGIHRYHRLGLEYEITHLDRLDHAACDQRMVAPLQDANGSIVLRVDLPPDDGIVDVATVLVQMLGRTIRSITQLEIITTEQHAHRDVFAPTEIRDAQGNVVASCATINALAQLSTANSGHVSQSFMQSEDQANAPSPSPAGEACARYVLNAINTGELPNLRHFGWALTGRRSAMASVAAACLAHILRVPVQTDTRPHTPVISNAGPLPQKRKLPSHFMLKA